MKLFVYEYITSGALIDDALPESLAHEGEAMFNALLQDLAAIQGLELCFIRDIRLPPVNVKATYQSISNSADYLTTWQSYIEQCDYALIIAPETSDILLNKAQQVPESKFLGCSKQAIAVCSNKYQTYERLTKNNIETVATVTAKDWLAMTSNYGDVIVKPFDGAGCLDTFQFSTEKAIKYIQGLTLEQQENCIVQSFINGTAASISCFIDSKVHILNINEQFLRLEDEQLIFEGCGNTDTVNSMLNIEQALDLTESVANAIQGLWGFIGIDLVLTNDGPIVIEINPRLTTAYLDLKNHLDSNPALLLTEALTYK